MSNDIATQDAGSLMNLGNTQVADLSKYGKETTFLKRVQLFTKGKLVDKGKIRGGHYGVLEGDDQVTDLGEAIDILILAARDKALDTTQDPPLAVFDENDDVFADIVERSKGSDSGCMWGPSFLIFERNTATLYEG